jgi:hypothetical protein
VLNPAFFKKNGENDVVSGQSPVYRPFPFALTPKSHACCVSILKQIAFVHMYEGALSTAKKTQVRG